MRELTIAVVTYNRLPYLKICLSSLLRQTFRDFNLIVYDNASTDDTEGYVTSLAKLGVKYIRQPENVGAVQNGNAALDGCSTKYLILMHDDDEVDEYYVEAMLSEAKRNPEALLVTSDMKIIDENGVDCGRLFRGWRGITRLSRYEYIYRYVAFGNCVNAPATLLNWGLLKEHGIRLSPKAGPENDALFWAEVNCFSGSFLLIPFVGFKYRMHAGQDSANGSDLFLVRQYDEFNLFLTRQKLPIAVLLYRLKFLRQLLKASFRRRVVALDALDKISSYMKNVRSVSVCERCFLTALRWVRGIVPV